MCVLPLAWSFHPVVAFCSEGVTVWEEGPAYVVLDFHPLTKWESSSHVTDMSVTLGTCPSTEEHSAYLDAGMKAGAGQNCKQIGSCPSTRAEGYHSLLHCHRKHAFLSNALYKGSCEVTRP